MQLQTCLKPPSSGFHLFARLVKSGVKIIALQPELHFSGALFFFLPTHTFSESSAATAVAEPDHGLFVQNQATDKIVVLDVLWASSVGYDQLRARG